MTSDYKIDEFYMKKFNLIKADIVAFLEANKHNKLNQWLLPNTKSETTTDPQHYLSKLPDHQIISWFKDMKLSFTPYHIDQDFKNRIITPESRGANVKYFFDKVEPEIVKLTDKKIKEIEAKKEAVKVG